MYEKKTDVIKKEVIIQDKITLECTPKFDWPISYSLTIA